MIKRIKKAWARWFLVEGTVEEAQRNLIQVLSRDLGLHVTYRDEDTVTFTRHQMSWKTTTTTAGFEHSRRAEEFPTSLYFTPHDENTTEVLLRSSEKFANRQQIAMTISNSGVVLRGERQRPKDLDLTAR